MTQSQIDAVIEAYAQGGANAQRLGFDGAEIHAAHGYLIDQFFWQASNQRTDRYGGGVAERTRFACEVVAACRRAVGDDFPILLRFSQWKIADSMPGLRPRPAFWHNSSSRLRTRGSTSSTVRRAAFGNRSLKDRISTWLAGPKS